MSVLGRGEFVNGISEDAIYYSVDKARVTHDRLQDEVIIINVSTGSYFSGSGTAADI